MSDNDNKKKYLYSEIFYSCQGEGNYTGTPGPWIRFYLCNLQCNAFGQDNPLDPKSWELPYENFDVSKVKDILDLPVWNKGCDSSYTWSKKYKHLMHKETADVIADRIIDSMKNEFNPEGLFLHPKSNQEQHLHITGGEPMINQPAIKELLEAFEAKNNYPKFLTVETNGTKVLNQHGIDAIKSHTAKGGEWFWSLSPKLKTVSGEERTKAILPEVIKSYFDLSSRGQLKFVVGHYDYQWTELDEVVKIFKDANIEFPVWVMPVGATVEDQTATAGDVANMARDRGFKVAARMHCYLWGNAIGV